MNIERPPSEYFAKLMFDTVTHYGPALNYLIETVGVERVMLGTDYPFDMGEDRPVDVVNAVADLPESDRDRIRSGNALRLLGLPA